MQANHDTVDVTCKCKCISDTKSCCHLRSQRPGPGIEPGDALHISLQNHASFFKAEVCLMRAEPGKEQKVEFYPCPGLGYRVNMLSLFMSQDPYSQQGYQALALPLGTNLREGESECSLEGMPTGPLHGSFADPSQRLPISYFRKAWWRHSQTLQSNLPLKPTKGPALCPGG